VQCYACNAPVRSSARFCSSCGRPQLLNDRYRLQRLLGQGGFAVVYEAEDIRLGRRCALKAVPVPTPDEQRLVESEAQILSANASRLPFIPDIYDTWSAGGQTYLVMEYIDGDTLDLVATPWPVSEVEGFLQALLHALDQLHAAGIIHRDLKPANIKRTPRGYVLLDFGIAKQGAATMRVARAASLDFAPLEQLRGQPTDQRTDLYSLAATAYFLLTGTGPTAADARLMGANLEPLSRFVTGISPALEALLLRMLALEPAQRPASARAALDLLAVAASATTSAGGGQAAHSPGISTTAGAAGVASSAGLPTTRLAEGAAPPPPVTAERVLVVSPDGSGDYTMIGEAIKAAVGGTRILVRPGYYEEGLVIDRNVEIVGDGPRDEIVVAAEHGDALLMACDEASVRGLSLRTLAGNHDGKYFSIDVPRGRLLLEDCAITSNSLACIGIHNHTAEPVIRRCLISESKQGGIYLYNAARVTIEECEITGSSLAAVEVSGGSTMTMRNCKVYDVKQTGVYIWGNSDGLVEDCEVVNTGLSSFSFKQGATPTVRRCTSRDSQQSGFFISDYGGGIIEDCRVIGSGYAGIAIASHATPTLRRCVVEGGKESGLYVYEEGEGLIESCEFANNGNAGASISERSNPTLRDCRIYGSQQSGISINSDALGLIEGCDIYGNSLGGISVARGANPTIRGCRIHSGKQGGVLSYNDGLGLLEDCSIFGNRYAGIEIREGGGITVRRCRLYDGQTSGVQVSEGGSGLIEGCEIYGHAVAGVIIMREGMPTVQGCTIRANRQNGVTIEAQGNGRFEECQIVENQLAGVEIRGGGVDLQRCIISRNRFQAIYAHTKAEASVSDCDLRGNGRGPWLIASGAQVKQSGNQV
jgi:F-box protein 11